MLLVVRWWRRRRRLLLLLLLLLMVVAWMLRDRRHGQSTLWRPIKGSTTEASTLQIRRRDVQLVVV